MFKKMQNRKGFTLVEMLVVIAVIAILVSIIIPTVVGSRDKAAAATNASNLRSVQGEVVTLMLMDPTVFGDQASTLNGILADRAELETELENIETVDEYVTQLKAAADNANEALSKADEALKKIAYDETNPHANCAGEYSGSCTQGLEVADCVSAKSSLSAYTHRKCSSSLTGTCNVLGKSLSDIGLSDLSTAFACISVRTSKAAYDTAKDVYDKAVEAADKAEQAYDDYIENEKKENADAQAANKKAEYDMYRFVAENGVLKINDEISFEAPASKAVSTDTVNIGEDQQMIVYIDTMNYQAYAYYTGDAEYGVSDFAAIAED